MTDPHDDAHEDLTALHDKYATHFRPIITKTSETRWRAQYPGLDWHVIADSEAAAAEEIGNEAMRRADAGLPDAQPPHDLLEQHLANPIPGVYALDRELFLYVRSRFGVAQTLLAFEEAERRRAVGQSYTKDDWLAEQ